MNMTDQVVCVVKGPWIDPTTSEVVLGPVPVLNGIYTVVDALGEGDNAGYSLAEFPLPQPYYWATSGFRPVKQTSIAVFRALLAPIETKEKEAVL